MKALLAFISIWFLFVGIILFPSKPLIVFLLLGFGGLLLAIAYDAFEKPAFFLVPISAILSGIFFGYSDAKGIFPGIGMLIGIAISSRCIKYYYGSKETKFEKNQELETEIKSKKS